MFFDWLESVSYLTWCEWCQTFDSCLTYSLNNRESTRFKTSRGFKGQKYWLVSVAFSLDHLRSCPRSLFVLSYQFCLPTHQFSLYFCLIHQPLILNFSFQAYLISISFICIAFQNCLILVVSSSSLFFSCPLSPFLFPVLGLNPMHAITLTLGYAPHHLPSWECAYLHKSYADLCPDSFLGSASMGGCVPLELSSQSGSPPQCGGWPQAEAGATVQDGIAYLALWEEGGIRARPFMLAQPPALMIAFLWCFCQAVVRLATSHLHVAGGRGTRAAACGF